MSDWKKELCYAIWNNNISDFDRILSQSYVEIEIQDINKWKEHQDPLHQAAENGRDQMLIKLLDAGAKVNAYRYSYNFDRKYKCTALHLAALYNGISAVQILIMNGADEEKYGECKTCLVEMYEVSVIVLQKHLMKRCHKLRS